MGIGRVDLPIRGVLRSRSVPLLWIGEPPGLRLVLMSLFLSNIGDPGGNTISLGAIDDRTISSRESGTEVRRLNKVLHNGGGGDVERALGYITGRL
jgi:hypothetical protein